MVKVQVEKTWNQCIRFFDDTKTGMKHHCSINISLKIFTYFTEAIASITFHIKSMNRSGMEHSVHPERSKCIFCFHSL